MLYVFFELVILYHISGRTVGMACVTMFELISALLRRMAYTFLFVLFSIAHMANIFGLP
jgi:hypothetical protein